MQEAGLHASSVGMGQNSSGASSGQSISSTLVKAARYPIYAVQLFTGAKSFRDNPIIGNTLLNRLGLHVARVVIAAAMTKFRYWCLTPFMSKDDREAYNRDGYLLIENFLPADEFSALNDEVRAMKEVEVRQCIQGDTLTQRVLLSDTVLDSAPECKKLISSADFIKRMKFTSARNSQPIFYVQNIKSNAVEAEADPQRHLHSDTFHATMKAWLFLDDVGDHNGPFTYVKGSHKLSLQRLKWEYRKSIEGSSQTNSYGSRGSLRVADEELPGLGMPAPQAFKVPANTLVIADTHGFHRRGVANEKSNRMEIWAFSRTNPFNPLPGFNFQWYNKLSHKVIDTYLKRQDRKAELKGMRSSWHLVDYKEMFTSKEQAPTQPKEQRKEVEAA